MQRMHERHRAAISRLQAISELAPERRDEIIERAQVLSFAPRTFVFKKGEEDPRALFVLEGRVDLVCDGQLIKTVEGGTPGAGRALAKVTPRRLGALARTATVVASLDAAAIAAAPLQTGAPTPRAETLEVAEIEQKEAGDWMTRLLQSKLLARLPAANIQQIFARMEPVELEPGEAVVRQGETGDYYYVVRAGRCVVTRHPAGDEGSTIKLAELGEGDGFGEEALVTGGTRGATVRMLSSGVVMRLARRDFESLIRIPCTSAIDAAEAIEQVQRGAAWLDVRPGGSGKHSAPADAVCVPINTLPMRVQRLDANRSYVAVCDSGELAATAAFLLTQHGLDAAVLRGGLARLSGAPEPTSSQAAPTQAASSQAGPPQAAPPQAASPQATSSQAVSSQRSSASETTAAPETVRAKGESAERAAAVSAGSAATASPASRRPKPSADKARLEAARRSFERRVQSERARLAERERESERRLAAAIVLKERAETEREALSRNLADSLRSSREQLESEAARADSALAEVERLKAEVDSARRVAARERGVKEARERELESLRHRAEARFAREELRIREEQRRHERELSELRTRREELEGELETVRGRLEAAEDSRRVAQIEAQRKREVAESTPVADAGEFTRTREELKRALAAERAQVRAERERLESQADRLQALLEEVRRMREETDACRGSRAPASAPAEPVAKPRKTVERPSREVPAPEPRKTLERPAPEVPAAEPRKTLERPAPEVPAARPRKTVERPVPEVPASVHGHTEFDEDRVLAAELLASIRRPRKGEREEDSSAEAQRRQAS